MKNQENLRNWNRWEEIQELELLNIIQYLGRSPGTGKEFWWMKFVTELLVVYRW